LPPATKYPFWLAIFPTSAYDPKKLIKAFKKEFACNGNLVDDEESGSQVIQLQGDQRQKISTFLAEEVGIAKAEIKVHGF
jgi:translation initiation factor 1